jgi:hypothetical protein
MIIGGRDEAWRLRDHKEAAIALRARKVDISFRIVPERDHQTIRRAAGEEQAEPTLAEILTFLADRAGSGGAARPDAAGKHSAHAYADVEGRAAYAHIR